MNQPAEPAEIVGSDPPREPLWWTRNPLRVKLVAAFFGLVALALMAISVSSAYALNRHLIDRADAQLWDFSHRIDFASAVGSRVLLPTDFVASGYNVGGEWKILVDTARYEPADLPTISTDPAVADGAMLNTPFTVIAKNGSYRWRVLIDEDVSGGRVVFAENLSNVDSAIDRLVFVELLVGAGMLVILALAGAWLVRLSLRPLAAIERTSAAIAKGDLTQRVPELDPRTELGQLSGALNTMLAQIETAFLARAASEGAARHAADAARTSEARAVRSEERMRQFIADASHELRTPLTTIRGFAELYRQGAAPDPADVLRRIEDEAARMGLLVEDLLLLARLDRERPMEYAPVPLVNLIGDAAAAAHAVAPERTIQVDITEPADRLVVEGDEARLRQIIGNLVTNALVHTPPGTPVDLRLRPDGDGHAVIEVADRGPGLTPEQAEHVFERFYRVDKARTRQAASSQGVGTQHSGTGLGLAIVAALVAAHGGTVDVESTPETGATFRVRLPLAVAHAHR